MERKYITTGVLMASLSHNRGAEKDIYSQLEETIALRKKILEEWEKLFLPGRVQSEKDIHSRLADTLAERGKILQQFFRGKDGCYNSINQEAA
jgi:hypothetical protein